MVYFTPPSRKINGFEIRPYVVDHQDPWTINLEITGQTGQQWNWLFSWDPNYWYIDTQFGHSHDNFSACERRRRGTFCIFTNTFRDRDWLRWGKITGEFAYDPASGHTLWVFCIGQSIKKYSISSEVPNLNEGLVNSFAATELQIGNSLIASRGEQIQSVRLQVFGQQGRVFVDRETLGNAAASHIESAEKQLANGVYFYLVTVKSSNGTVYRSQVKKVIVLR